MKRGSVPLARLTAGCYLELMVSSLRAEYYITPEEYLAGERTSQEKHEYLAGVVYAMAGATEAHNVISQNISGAL